MFDNDGFPGCLVIYGIVILIVIIVAAIVSAVRITEFDKSFDRGEILLQGQVIPLGTEGNPVAGDIPEFVPEGGGSFEKYPRLFRVSKCKSYTLPEDSTGIYAVTPYHQPEVVEITIPSQVSGAANVCVPEGIEVTVVIWSK